MTESAEIIILFGLNVVFQKIGQAFIRYLLCILVSDELLEFGNNKLRELLASQKEQTDVRGCPPTV